MFTRWRVVSRWCVFDNGSGVGRQRAETARLTELFSGSRRTTASRPRSALRTAATKKATSRTTPAVCGGITTATRVNPGDAELKYATRRTPLTLSGERVFAFVSSQYPVAFQRAGSRACERAGLQAKAGSQPEGFCRAAGVFLAIRERRRAKVTGDAIEKGAMNFICHKVARRPWPM